MEEERPFEQADFDAEGAVPAEFSVRNAALAASIGDELFRE